METDRNQSMTETKVGLGPDLPDTEAALFELDHYPLLDIEVGKKVVGSEALARDLLNDLIMVMPDDLSLIKKAHTQGNWKEVEELAHKMKGGSDFGTVRMHYALLYMERYLKAGHTKLLEELYAQMLQVIDETMVYLDKCLKAG